MTEELSVDFPYPTTNKVVTHYAVDPPICEECQELDLSFFDPTCIGCQDILTNPRTTISEIFAIIRQWVPQTQQNIDVLVKEIFRRGAHTDDKDGLTDMNLLHYAAKSGANGIGDIEVSTKLIKMLLRQGADVNVRCRWTDMTALHYAVYFDIEPVVAVLIEATGEQDLDHCCKEFDNGTALHIGCINLCLNSIQTLLKHGANPHYPNKLGKLPIHCISTEILESNADAVQTANSIRNLLSSAMLSTEPSRKHNLSLSTLQALGLELYDQVSVAGKIGTLKFCGSTDFASGQWAGIELNDPIGKNDGSVAGVRYFTCKSKYGIFAPLTRVNKYDGSQSLPLSTTISSSNSSRSSSMLSNSSSLNLGDKVIVAGQKVGFVRYFGPTKFASGTWVGVELDVPVGKNDGFVAGVRYFRCDSKHGIFAPLSKVERIPDEDVSSTVDASVDASVIRKDKSMHIKTNDTENDDADSGSHGNNDTGNHGEMSVDHDKGNSSQTTFADSLISVTKKLHDSHIKKSPNINRVKTEELIQPKKSAKLDTTLGAKLNFTLKNGMSVYVNNELGIVRYIGRVEFADDVWLGIELRKPNGKNDGSVENKKYFTCKPNYGLMVRASRATCRGINCAQLIDLKFR